MIRGGSYSSFAEEMPVFVHMQEYLNYCLTFS